jgi:putative DNA primase/helicase
MNDMNFTEKQLKELEASAIVRDLADLNIPALEGDRALDAIFYSLGSEERKNDGRVSDKWLRKYEHVRKHGGLAFYGVDPITGERTECISFKPTVPLPDRKYEQPPKSPNQAFYPAVTDRVWQLVSDRFNVPMPTIEVVTFWVWVGKNNIPIILTEGCKKALSALSHGFPCVALTGVWNGLITHRDDNGDVTERELIPSLQHLAGQKIYIAFDCDRQASTIKKVTQARLALAKALTEIDCECYVMRWDVGHKGLDDLIASCGAEAVERSIDRAKVETGEEPQFKQKIVKNMLSEDLAKESKGQICFDEVSKTWHLYKGGRWATKGKDSMEAGIYHRVIQYVPEINNVNLVPDVMRFMKHKLLVEEWKEASTLEYFPFKNGVWSFKERKLLPHSPDYFWKWQLDRDYSLSATGWNSIGKFLKTVSSGDESIENLLIAACAAVLQGRPDIQKALYLFGSGANGKGSFLKLLEMLVGENNTHSTTLENICENRFEMANLCDKRLVVCPDEDRRIRGLSAFKSLTGGDSLRGEEKGKKAYKFTFKGMVAIASNTPIFFGDDSYGLARRLIPIPFRHQVPESQRRNLIPEFTTDLPAFTTYLLNLDRDWVTDTLKQAKDLPSIKNLEWELTLRSDSVAAFYEEKLIYAPGVEIPAAQIYGEYKQFCIDTGFSAKHQNNFSPSLVNLLVDKLGKDVKSRKTKIGKVIEGLRLRTVLDPIGDEVTTVTAQDRNKLFADRGDEVTAVTTVTMVTTQTEKQLSLEIAPKPPSSDRLIPHTTKVGDSIEYMVSDGEVKWLEIYFDKHTIAKAWVKQLTLWGCQTSELKKRRQEEGKWLLRVKGLTISRLEMLLRVDIQQWPQAPSRV